MRNAAREGAKHNAHGLFVNIVISMKRLLTVKLLLVDSSHIANHVKHEAVGRSRAAFYSRS
jgi:hypothetical protein